MNDIKDDPSLKVKFSLNKDKIDNDPKKNSFNTEMLLDKNIYKNKEETKKEN